MHLEAIFPNNSRPDKLINIVKQRFEQNGLNKNIDIIYPLQNCL